MNGLVITGVAIAFAVFVYVWVKRGKKKTVSTAPKKKTGSIVSEGFAEKPTENKQ